MSCLLPSTRHVDVPLLWEQCGPCAVNPVAVEYWLTQVTLRVCILWALRESKLESISGSGQVPKGIAGAA